MITLNAVEEQSEGLASDAHVRLKYRAPAGAQGWGDRSRVASAERLLPAGVTALQVEADASQCERSGGGDPESLTPWSP